MSEERRRPFHAPVRTVAAGVFAILLGTGCEGGVVQTGQPCGQSIEAYCGRASAGCPRSSDSMCEWLASRGLRSYGGPVACKGLGEGWDVYDDAGEFDYLFDDAGLVAVLREGPDGGCLAGPSYVDRSSCENYTVGVVCIGDAGRE